jgi:hypothetical protein
MATKSSGGKKAALLGKKMVCGLSDRSPGEVNRSRGVELKGLILAIL